MASSWRDINESAWESAKVYHRFFWALEGLALATSGLLVMADFTKPVVSTQEGFFASLVVLSGPVKKSRYRSTKTVVKSPCVRRVYTCRFSGPSGKAAADWFRTAS
jgi:hypothetical protein